MTNPRGSHVIITGGSEGIGHAAAGRLVAEGARVSLIARDATKLERAARALSGAATWRSADVTDAQAVADAVADLEREVGPCDILVCCAGFALPGSFADVPLDELDAQWAVNLRGSAAAARTVLPGMMQRGDGHLVFTSSVGGLVGVYGYTGYAASKFGVRGFAEALRYEVEPAGIRVTVLFPPDTDTPGFARENLRKPAETAAVSGTIAPVSAEKVASALVRGVARDRPTVTVDATSAVLLRFGGLIEPFVRRGMRRAIARARRAR